MIAAAKSHKPSPIDRLLIEAGSVTANSNSAVFRNAAAREVGALFLPGPPDIAAGKSVAARALRESIKAFAVATSTETRNQIGAAIVGLAAPVRAEPDVAPPTKHVPVGTPRQYWIEAD